MWACEGVLCSGWENLGDSDSYVTGKTQQQSQQQQHQVLPV